MEGIDSTSSTLDLGVKGRYARRHLIAWWMEVVVQCTGTWRQRGRETLAGHEVGRASAMVRSLHELGWREEKGGERGSLDEKVC